MKKKVSLLFLLACFAVGVNAQKFIGDGYYRVQNNYTERYAYLLDNFVKVDVTASKVTLTAIELWKGIERAQSDPATVLYIKQVGSQYDITGQGTSLKSMADVYMGLRYDESRNAYLAYGTYSGMTKYLTDNTKSLTAEQAWMTDTRYEEYSYWRLLSINNSTDNFFGFKPNIKAKGKNYLSMYCGFPFAACEGMKINYVSKIDAKRGYAIYKTVTSGKVDSSTPIFIECPSEMPAGNKVVLGPSNPTKVTDNQLTGVFFNINNKRHINVNQVVVDKNTMRLLGVTKDGSLGFIVTDDETVPRNSSYLKVPAGSPEQFKLVTEEEYQYILDHEVVEAETVKLSLSNLSLRIGGSYTLTATVLPDNTTDKTVVWSSSNADIVSVDNGKVKALALGEAVITAKCGKATATCTVKVNPILAESITISETEKTLIVGEMAQLGATVYPSNTTDKSLVWTSSDESIVAVDENGLIKGVKAGEATVTVACGEVKAECKVTVTLPPLEGVSLNMSSIILRIGEEETLEAQIYPEDADKSHLKWKSEDESIATVDDNGVVRAVAYGETKITVSIDDASASCTVTVLKFDQVIVWDQDFGELKEGDEVELMASATSDLNVTYEITLGVENASLSENHLSLKNAGTVVVKATQAGNHTYNAATPVEKTIDILSSISAVALDGVKVSVVGSNVSIEGVADDIEIAAYDINGQLIYAGYDKTFSVAGHNVVVVKIGSVVLKILVK